MSESRDQDIDRILQTWGYQPGTISARLVRARDGREVLQMRIEMGVLQMEIQGRPDGEMPEGAETFLDCLIQQSFGEDEGFVLSDEQCFEVDREFLQYYHRRICWLALKDFRRAIDDADHTLALMDFAAEHSPDRRWTLSHEQYRPFVIFHRTQATALDSLKESGPEAAIEQINIGLERMREVYAALGTQEEFAEDELVAQLQGLQESLREEYAVGRTLNEQLSDAIAAEEYERAARLRDQIARRAKHL